QTTASNDFAIDISDNIIREGLLQCRVRTWQHQPLRRVVSNDSHYRVDVLAFRLADCHDASPNIVRPTRTTSIPPSIAAFTARSLGIIPPLTKLAVSSSSGRFNFSITAP